MMWQGRVGQFCDFAGVRIWETDSICFDMNIADYIEAVHADDFSAAIGQIAVCEPGRVHHAARSCGRRNARINSPLLPPLSSIAVTVYPSDCRPLFHDLARAYGLQPFGEGI